MNEPQRLAWSAAEDRRLVLLAEAEQDKTVGWMREWEATGEYSTD